MRKGGSSGSTFLKRKILLEIRSMSIGTVDISYQIRCLLEIERFGHIFFCCQDFLLSWHEFFIFFCMVQVLLHILCNMFVLNFIRFLV